MAPNSGGYGGLARDPDAFAGLYQEHAPRVYRHILYMVGRKQEAEELANETFLYAWKAIERYEDRGIPIQNWLLRIAHNVAARHLKHRRQTVPIGDFDFVGDPSPERNLESKIEAEEVRSAILQLPDVQRQVIVWRFLEDMSYDEVEALLGKTKAAIRVIQFRALKRLRQVLEEREQAARLPRPSRLPALGRPIPVEGVEPVPLGSAS